METNSLETNQDVAIEHQNVPVAHQGLHGFLYSSDDEHTAVVTTIPQIENDSAEIVPLETWCVRAATPQEYRISNAKVAGVYAVLDSQHHTQYIGYSRNVLLSLNGHLTQNGKDKCAFVRVHTFKFPKREEMESLRDQWMSELDSIPPGNSSDREMWASTIGEAAKAAMSAVERNAYEEKKLKLRKAMADTALNRNLEAIDATEAQRRENLEAAVKNDDWSAVISEQ
ncbi:MAG: GIY-YIG nuclease family protein [Crinalium sp.]